MAAEPQRVAILPFKMNAEKDLSFLRNGIFDMLSSRLSDPDKVQVLSRTEVEKVVAEETGPAEKDPIDEATARRIGAKLKADYVVYGSLTVFGDSLSIDAKMLDVAGTQPPVTVFSQSSDMSGVIPEIDRFAAEINTKVFGRQAQAAATVPPPAAPRTGSQPDSRAHPEKLLQGGAVVGGDAQVSPFIKPKEQLLQSASFWKSTNFNYYIAGVAVGDVDGDGLMETVIVSPDEIYIYRFQNNSFVQIQRLKKVEDRYNIAVDVADINGNGRAEIFVTAFNRYKNVVYSFVEEYDGKDYAVITKDQPWFFRVTDTPVRGRVLLGQQTRLNNPYGGDIFEMQWDGGAYVPQNAIKTPSGVNVLGVALGDVLNDGAETLVACNSGNNIAIVTPFGDVLYKSNDRYGGNVQYLHRPKNRPGAGGKPDLPAHADPGPKPTKRHRQEPGHRRQQPRGYEHALEPAGFHRSEYRGLVLGSGISEHRMEHAQDEALHQRHPDRRYRQRRQRRTAGFPDHQGGRYHSDLGQIDPDRL